MSQSVKILHPQEIVVWHILPALRKEIVISLKKKGFSQRKIAGILGLTESAVSQYEHKKRASSIILSSELKRQISISSDAIAKGESVLLHLNKLLSSHYVQMHICEFHHQNSSFPKGCRECFQ